MSILDTLIADPSADSRLARGLVVLTFFGAPLEAQLEACPSALPKATVALPGPGLRLDLPHGDYWASSPLDALLGCLSAIAAILDLRLVVSGLGTDELDERVHAVRAQVDDCLARGPSVTLVDPELGRLRTLTAELAAALGLLPRMPSRAALTELIANFEHP